MHRGSAEGGSKFSLYNTAAPNKGALRPAYLRALSVLITAAKVSVLHPQQFASKSLDVMCSSVWAGLLNWGLAELQLGSKMHHDSLSSNISLVLQPVPMLSSMLKNQNIHFHLSPSGQIRFVNSIRPLPLLAAYVVSLAHKSEPFQGLAILTSTQAWSFLELGVKIISEYGQLHPTSSAEVDRIRSASNVESDIMSQPVIYATCVLTAYLGFVMEDMFLAAADMPLTFIGFHLFQLQDLNKGFISIESFRSISSSFYNPFQVGLVSELQLLSEAHLTKQGQAGCFKSSFIAVMNRRADNIGAEGHDYLCVSKSPQFSAALAPISILAHVLDNPLWELLLQQQQPLPDSTLLSILPLMISSLYQAVAIVEVFLEASGGGISFTPDIEQRWQDARSSIGELVLTSLSDIGWPKAAPLLRSSLLHLAEVVKTCVRGSSPFVPRDWELVLLELMMDVNDEVWGVRPCCNPSCNRLEGPCELTVKTFACGGECGMRYCCQSCQEEAWRAGHRCNCTKMREASGISSTMRAIDFHNVFIYC